MAEELQALERKKEYLGVGLVPLRVSDRFETSRCTR